MKVKDLIEQLSKLDPEMGVLYFRQYQDEEEEGYEDGENFMFGLKRMVEISQCIDDEVVEIELEPFENYEYKDELSIEDSKEYLILNWYGD